MMIYHSKNINQKGKLVAVMEEQLPANISDLEFITHNEEKYKVFDWFKFHKNEMFPQALMRIATGKILTSKQVFGFFKRSNYLYIILCESTN